MKTNRRVWAGGGFLLLCLAAISPPLGAQSEKGQFYALLSFSYLGIRGDSFNGNSGIESSGIFASVPKINPGPGGSLVLGIRGETFGVEFGYGFSSHTGTAYDPTLEGSNYREAKSIAHVLLLDFKFHFWPNRTVGVYAVGGLAVSFLNVKNGIFGQEPVESPDAENGTTYRWVLLGNATYLGFGFDLGAGLEIALGENWALTAGALVRPLFFTSVNLSATTGSVSESFLGNFSVEGLNGLALAASLGLQFNFTKR